MIRSVCLPLFFGDGLYVRFPNLGLSFGGLGKKRECEENEFAGKSKHIEREGCQKNNGEAQSALFLAFLQYGKAIYPVGACATIFMQCSNLTPSLDLVSHNPSCAFTTFGTFNAGERSQRECESGAFFVHFVLMKYAWGDM